MPRIGFWWTFDHRLSQAPVSILALRDWMRTEIGRRVPFMTAADRQLGFFYKIDEAAFDGLRSRAEIRREGVARARAEAEAYEEGRRRYAAPPPRAQTPLEADWRVLGLTWPFSTEDAKKAYRAAVKKCHPDTGGTKEAFIEVHAAYERVLAAAGHAAATP
jgi:hypothetical protein